MIQIPNSSFKIKHKPHFKLYVLLKDSIVFETELIKKDIMFYSELNEQPDISGGIRYFLLDTDAKKIDCIVIENNIQASTETITVPDIEDKKKMLKKTVLLIGFLILIILILFAIENIL
ncbi:MAG: hypothetical protein COB12_05190 [Flavobacterium sp.]|nr:MAG: hypothetical protein COB12_05190 [Flavobacterium sp.]